MTPDQHRMMRERIGADVSGRLPPEERQALQVHLADCAACRAEREGLLPVLSALRAVDPDRIAAPIPEPSTDLIDRILEGTVAQATDPVPGRRRQPVAGGRTSSLTERRRRPLGHALLAIAAALALVAVGVGIGSQAFPRAAPGPPFETVAFRQAPPGVTASGRLIAHTWGTEIQLIVTGLNDGQRYRADFYSEDGTKFSGGTFIGVAAPMVCNLNAAILRPDVTRLRVTTDEGEVVLEAELAVSSA